jgi:hypothetical protein
VAQVTQGAHVCGSSSGLGQSTAVDTVTRGPSCRRRAAAHFAPACHSPWPPETAAPTAAPQASGCRAAEHSAATTGKAGATTAAAMAAAAAAATVANLHAPTAAASAAARHGLLRAAATPAVLRAAVRSNLWVHDSVMRVELFLLSHGT